MTIYVAIKNYYNYNEDCEGSHPIKAFNKYDDAYEFINEIADKIAKDGNYWDMFSFDYEPAQITISKDNKPNIFIERRINTMSFEEYMLTITELELK